MSAYVIHLRGEETLHLGVEVDDHDAALLQRIARMTQDLSCGYQPDMTVEAAPGAPAEDCPSCGATGDMAGGN